MKKKSIALASVIVILNAALLFFWPYLKMEFASSAYYKQDDTKKYNYYTPELLKHIPRISSNYTFEFGHVSGPEAYVYTVRFQTATDTEEINNYLTSAGYRLQTQCDVEAECWRKPLSRDIVTVIKYTAPDCIVVQIYRSQYVEPYAG